MVNIKVAVRIRPLSQRELLRGEEVIVRKENKSVLVNNPKVPEKQDGDGRQRIQRFAVDFCYDPKEPEGCSQEAVYNEIGLEVLDSMFEGYNACLLAYGHSASGKTYTIMGLQDDPGLTPRLCQGLFEKLNKERSDGRIRVQVVISFLEIYNEKVRDLLRSEEVGETSGNFSLRVREHPKLGPYVQGLSRHLVTDKKKLVGLLTKGNRRRSTAATENNIHSSRSHAVFTIQFKQSDGKNYETEKSSEVHLVDLAGSERANSSQSKTRLKEGANINKSLVTLGNVISALAEHCESDSFLEEHSGSKSWQPFVPYRDSVLTWLLKDTLGGNSNTIMIATISPASGCLAETLNTLRYAKRTKRIVNQPIINEDPKIRTIRQLRKEIARLRCLLFSFQSCDSWCKLEENNLEGTMVFSSPESKWLDSAGTVITTKEDKKNKKENLEKVFFEKKETVINNKTNEDEEKGKKIESLALSTPSKYETDVLGERAAPPRDDACKINDAKKSDVNGSFNDNFSHETLIFSDSLESFSSIFDKRKNSCNVDAKADNDGSRRFGLAEFGCESREFSAENLSFRLTRVFGSYENFLREDFSTMLRRSRPDLIKGISTRSKENQPSESSQNCTTDLSNLSQSPSENSLTSPASANIQTSEKNLLQNLQAQTLKSPEDEEEREKVGAVRKGQKNESLRTLLRKKDRRSEIVDAVTSRLYVAKKKPNRQVEVRKKKKEGEEVEEEDEEEEEEEEEVRELEELKLCRRARMKLFDLSRKLAMTRKIKKTMDSGIQTDSTTTTLRLKEKCITTDESGLTDYKTIGNSEESSREEEKPCVIMNQVFIPRGSNYVVECGKIVRIEAPEMAGRHESATQTSSEGGIYKNANTSPIKFSSEEDDYFSEDSLDLEEKSRHCDQTVAVSLPGKERKTKNELCPERNMNSDWPSDPGFYISSDSEAGFRKELKTFNFPEIKESKKTLPLAVLMEDGISSRRKMDLISGYSSESSMDESRKEENSSSENFFNSIEDTDTNCSSETSSEDFVFYENSKGKNLISKTKEMKDRELYTITENSEQSDPSDAFSPNQSPVFFLNAPDECKKKWEKQASSRRRLRANRLRFEKMKKELEKFDWPKESRELSKNGEMAESEHSFEENKGETKSSAIQSGNIFKNFVQNFNLNQNNSEKLKTLKSVSLTTTNVYSRSSDLDPNDFTTPHETKNFATKNKTEKKNLKSEGSQFRTEDCKTRMNQTNWKDFQSNSQKQYLNLNISGDSRASPFFVDTHLFGEPLRKDQSTDTMFNSSDSITFVFMGPAKPKTSVLMEIIQRSLGNASFSTETFFTREKWKNRGVTRNENLTRSISMDTAMIALSRIAKNQKLSSNIQKSFSLDRLNSNEALTSLGREKLQNQSETNYQCNFKAKSFKNGEKKTRLKSMVATTATSDEQTGNKTMKSNGMEEVEKPKKFVSWSGEAKRLWGLKSRVSEKADERKEPNFDPKHRYPQLKTQKLEENSHKLLPPRGEFDPPERRVRFLKPETWINDPTEQVENLTEFLKEAIQLFKNLNFCSSKMCFEEQKQQMMPNETMEKFNTETNRKRKENEKSGFEKLKNSESIRRSKTENCLAKDARRKSKLGEVANEMEVDEDSCNLTWPRRRQKTKKVPARMKSRFLKSPLSSRFNPLYSKDALNLTDCSTESNRVTLNGQSWNVSNLSVAFSNSCLGESKKRQSIIRSSNDTKCLRNFYSYPVASRKSNVPELNFDSISELESELQQSCHRLEIAAEQDKMRENVLGNWKTALETQSYNTRFWPETDDNEEKYQVAEEKVKKVIKRRKTEECIGKCICKKSGIKSCKYLWPRGYRSSFELDSFGPGSTHCQQLCMFCRKKDAEIYYSALCLNTECISASLCRLSFYGFCPCSSFRLRHISSSPRAYLQHLLALRRQIVNDTKRQPHYSAGRDECEDTKH